MWNARIRGLVCAVALTAAIAAGQLAPRAATEPAITITKTLPADYDPTSLPATRPTGEMAVLKLIPADAMAFVAVRNLGTGLKDTEAFLLACGAPKDSIDSMLATARHPLSEFNHDVGGALVLLDIKKYAPELAKEVAPASRPATKPAAGGMASEPAGGNDGADLEVRTTTAPDASAKPRLPSDEPQLRPQDIPFAAILGISDIAKALKESGDKAHRDGDVIKFADDVFAKQIAPGMYALSPRKEWLAAFGGKASILDKLSRESRAMAERNQAFAWVDWSAYSWFEKSKLMAALKHEAHLDEMGPMMVAQFPPLLAAPGVLEAMRDAAELCAGARVISTGLVVEAAAQFPPASVMGKHLAACKPTTAPLLTALPNTPYTFAAAATPDLKASKEFYNKRIRELVFAKDGPLSGVKPAVMDKFIDGLIACSQAERNVQFYFGEGAKGPGGLAMAWIVGCDSAGQYHKDLRKAVEAFFDFKGSLPEPFTQIILDWNAKSEKADDDTDVDVLTLSHPSMPPDMPEEAQKIMGDTGIRFRLAQANKNAYVATLLGGKEFMSAVVKAARENKGKLEKAMLVAAALAPLPRERSAVALLDLPAGFNLVAGIRASENNGPPPVPALMAPPIAASLTLRGNSIHAAVHVPAECIRSMATAAEAESRARQADYHRNGVNVVPEPPVAPAAVEEFPPLMNDNKVAPAHAVDEDAATETRVHAAATAPATTQADDDDEDDDDSTSQPATAPAKE